MNNPAKGAGGKLGEYSWGSPKVPNGGGRDRSATDVIKDIVGNLQEIIRSEVRLARAEIREEAGKALLAGRKLMIGAVLGLYGLGFLLLCIVYGLSLVVAPWLAALIVGLVLAVASGVLLMSGKGAMSHVKPAPDKTIDTMKENIEWIKGQTKS